jgi:hypothetical protein
VNINEALLNGSKIFFSFIILILKYPQFLLSFDCRQYIGVVRDRGYGYCISVFKIQKGRRITNIPNNTAIYSTIVKNALPTIFGNSNGCQLWPGIR